jgi:hypothetical protein
MLYVKKPVFVFIFLFFRFRASAERFRFSLYKTQIFNLIMGWVYRALRNIFSGSYGTGEPEDSAADVLRKSQLDRLDEMVRQARLSLDCANGERLAALDYMFRHRFTSRAATNI